MAVLSLGLRSDRLIRRTMSQFVRDHRVPGVGLPFKMTVIHFVLYTGINWGERFWEEETSDFGFFTSGC